MKTILFIDEVCPKPYDSTTLYTQSQGGTESTVTRVAQGLANTRVFNRVVVEQHNREVVQSSLESPLEFVPEGEVLQADYVICLRHPKTLEKARKRFPSAKIYLWCHDLWSSQTAEVSIPILHKTETKYILCVSQFHQMQINHAFGQVPIKIKTQLRVSYPPIDPTIDRDLKGYDKNQLAWFSSPHKGLENALLIFSEIKKKDPDMRFVVHNPGYFDSYNKPIPDGVVIKPIGSYYDAIETVKRSLCVFYPNTVFPETFGLVFAEANHVGTPVLTHELGSALEVLDHPTKETMNCQDVAAVVERVLSWKNGGRPVVRSKPHFRLPKVINNWLQSILD